MKTTHRFHAQHIELSEQDGIYFFGMATQYENPEEYVLIQYAKTFDEQDKELGQDAECFESSFTDGCFYGVVKTITVSSDTISVLVQDSDETIELVAVLRACTTTSAEVYVFLAAIPHIRHALVRKM